VDPRPEAPDPAELTVARPGHRPTKRGRVMRQSTLGFIAATILAAGLSGCGSSAAPATPPAPTPPGQGHAGAVTVGTTSVNVLCTGTTSTTPTIMLVAGMPDPLTMFTALQATLSQTTRVCSYDRPGEGASPKPTATQTLSDSATLLDGVLDAEKISGKVIVVGHSLGGLIAAQFAHQYPQRVAAVVLLDASAPSVGAAIESLIPASATGVPAEAREEVSSLSSATTNPEELIYAGQPIGSLGSTPLTVAQHGEKIYAVVPQYGDRLQDIWARGQQQLALLSSNSTLITVPQSGHYIYLDQPAVAVQLIEHATAG
jgi:pimeloyl-ACP methyl ester carboxylesterase